MNLLISVILIVNIVGCSDEKNNLSSEYKNIINERADKESLRDLINNDDFLLQDERVENDNTDFLLLNKPFWHFINDEFVISDDRKTYVSLNENKDWQYLENRFFTFIAKKYFGLHKNLNDRISFKDFFISTIFLKKNKVHLPSSRLRMKGASTLFNGRFRLEDEYARDRSWLSISHLIKRTPRLLFQKKIVEGENFFLIRNDSRNIESDVYIDEHYEAGLDFNNENEIVTIEFKNFFHHGASKTQIINDLTKEFDILFYKTDQLYTYLVKKGVSIQSVLKKIDPGLEFDEYGNILQSSGVRKNEFLKDFPRNRFLGNNLLSKGILFHQYDNRLMSNEINLPNVYLYYEGQYKNLMMRQFGLKVKNKSFGGHRLDLKLLKGEGFKLRTKETVYQEIFTDYEKEIEVMEKKPRLVCERYELKIDKFCIDNRKKYKVKAKFRKYLGRKKVKEHFYEPKFDLKKKNHINNGENQYSVIEFDFYGDRYNIVSVKNYPNRLLLDSINIDVNLKKQKCTKVKTGYMGLVQADLSIRPTEKQASVIKSYCEGPTYLHQISRIEMM